MNSTEDNNNECANCWDDCVEPEDAAEARAEQAFARWTAAGVELLHEIEEATKRNYAAIYADM